MKPRLSSKRNAAMTLFEVGIIVAVVVIFVAVVLHGGFKLNSAHSRARGINCVNNLKQVGLAYRIWEGDNGDVLPMGISITNGGSMEKVLAGDVLQTFLVMSNELSTPKILYCLDDLQRSQSFSFSTFSRSNVSYFVSADTTNDLNPLMILSGDSHFELRGVSAASGSVAYGTNEPVDWSVARHRGSGSLGLADGSVQMVVPRRLNYYFSQTGLATNRFAIP